MNDFMNTLFQFGENKTVTGRYCGCDFIGTISHIRSCAGGDLKVYIDFADDEHIFINGKHARDGIVLHGTDLFQGSSNVAENLHVYF